LTATLTVECNFLLAVSHSVGAHTESLQPRVDSSSSSSEDEDMAIGQSGARASSDDVSGVGISNSGSCINL